MAGEGDHLVAAFKVLKRGISFADNSEGKKSTAVGDLELAKYNLDSKLSSANSHESLLQEQTAQRARVSPLQDQLFAASRENPKDVPEFLIELEAAKKGLDRVEKEVIATGVGDVMKKKRSRQKNDEEPKTKRSCKKKVEAVEDAADELDEDSDEDRKTSRNQTVQYGDLTEEAKEKAQSKRFTFFHF